MSEIELEDLEYGFSEAQVRLTDSARRALIFAQREAELMGHRFVGAEHLLLGLMREKMGMAAVVLQGLGLGAEVVAEMLAHRSPAGPEPVPRAGIQLAPGGKKALQRALNAARLRGDSLVGSEQLLLTLVEQSEGPAARLLAGLGIAPDEVRDRLQKIIDDGDTDPPLERVQTERTLEQRYQIEEAVGQGSQSTIYRARDLRFKDVVRKVAVKESILQSDDPAQRALFARRFRREAEILATLKHPFVPRFYDFFNQGNRFYLVMEYIDGTDLETLLTEDPDPLPVSRVLRWALQLCDVLAYLHSRTPRPIILGDVKPSNLMVDRQDNVRLIDFNVARALRAGRRGARVGTEGYAPPEQYHGEAGPQGDLYALAATLHHLLTRQDPRSAAAFSFEERPIRAVNPQVSAELERVIFTALAYNPDDRFPSAAAMKQALLEAARSSGLDVRGL